MGPPRARSGECFADLARSLDVIPTPKDLFPSTVRSWQLAAHSQQRGADWQHRKQLKTESPQDGSPGASSLGPLLTVGCKLPTASYTKYSNRLRNWSGFIFTTAA